MEDHPMQAIPPNVLDVLAETLTCRRCRVVSPLVDVLNADIRCPRCGWPMP